MDSAKKIEILKNVCQKKKVKLKKINNQEVYNSKHYNKTAGIA